MRGLRWIGLVFPAMLAFNTSVLLVLKAWSGSLGRQDVVLGGVAVVAFLWLRGAWRAMRDDRGYAVAGATLLPLKLSWWRFALGLAPVWIVVSLLIAYGIRARDPVPAIVFVPALVSLGAFFATGWVRLRRELGSTGTFASVGGVGSTLFGPPGRAAVWFALTVGYIVVAGVIALIL